MKTETHIERARQAHHAALVALAKSINPESTASGLSLWRKLRRIETEATRATVAYCNGESDEAACGRACELAKHHVAEVFGEMPDGLFVNRDPRGYALKLDNERPGVGKMIAALRLHTDMGGHGILAPLID